MDSGLAAARRPGMTRGDSLSSYFFADLRFDVLRPDDLRPDDFLVALFRFAVLVFFVVFFVVFFAVLFPAFFAVFFFGAFMPAARASDSPIAIACLRLFTFLPERPLFSVPALVFLIARPTLAAAFFEYFRAIVSSRWNDDQ
jgi:hypothetical protein